MEDVLVCHVDDRVDIALYKLEAVLFDDVRPMLQKVVDTSTSGTYPVKLEMESSSGILYYVVVKDESFCLSAPLAMVSIDDDGLTERVTFLWAEPSRRSCPKD